MYEQIETQNSEKIKPASLIAGSTSKLLTFPVSIDKFSLTGFLKKDFSLPDWEARNMDLSERYSGGKIYRYSWKTDDYHVSFDPLGKDHDIRLEFNPNNVIYSQTFLALINALEYAKTTRIDLAVDYIDNLILSDFYVECLDKSSAEYKMQKTRNRSGWVFGSSGSSTLYRVYDKKLELKIKDKKDVDCETWWRAEMQIRPRGGKNWAEYSPFEDLQIAKQSFSDDVSPIDEAVLRCILQDTSYLSKFSQYHRSKYKKMIKQETCLESLSLDQHPFYVLKHARSWLDAQISVFLNEVK